MRRLQADLQAEREAREASTRAAEAMHAALVARLDAMTTRIDAAEHVAKSARGYVAKRLSLYAEEQEREEAAPTNGALRIDARLVR